jgi:hypothetical protein
MKTKVLIISFLIVALLGAFTLKANAQDRDKCPSVVNSPAPELLADETTLSYNKTEAKINCSNEIICDKILKSHEQLIKRLTWSWKTDRNGRYKHYMIYFAKGDAELIVKWAKTNL